MLTDQILGLIDFVDYFLSSNNAISDLITRTSSFVSSLSTALNNIKDAFMWLYFFIPKAYFEPLITIFLLIMLVKCITALINLVYP